MLRNLLLALSLAALPACITSPDLPGSDADLIVRSGTSFGMCIGRCITELSIEGEEAVLLERSRDGSNPRTRTARLTAEEWAALVALADVDDFDNLPETIGCPDCADG